MSDANTKTALENLQKQVEDQRKTIDKLSKQNKSLLAKVKELEGGKSPTSGNNSNDAGGVESGPSRAGAAAALMAKLGGGPKPPASSGGGGGDGGGVETGPSRAGAAAALMGKLGGPRKPPGGGGGGVGGDGGSGSSSSGGGGMEAIFSKYEKMMKLGISIHGALGRMVQNGEKSDVIDAFKKKHAEKLGGATEEKLDLQELGLTPKPKIQLQKNIKMKRLHWDPINPTRVPNSIWEDLDESTIKYDPKKFELNFQVRERKQVVQQTATVSNLNSNEKRFFVPKKRSQQVMIGIRGLGLSNKQLREVLHNMDEKVMTQEKISQLMDIIPSEDEQTQAEKEVTAFNGNVKQFGEAEQFFFNLCDFYHLEQRLKLWAFKMQFSELTSNLLEQFKQVQKSCDKVRNNKNLKQLLTVILAFGNHMNAGTRKGEAFGFDLKILGQLSNIKTHDNSRSLLMYIYEFCDNKYPKVLNVLSELKPLLKISASTETDVLNSLYDKVKENMKELQDIIESDDIEESYDMDDTFVPVMSKFYKKSQPSMKKFHMTVGNVLVSTKRIMKKFAFGSEEQPEPVEKLFQLLYQFLLDLETSKQKLVKLEAERAKKRKLRLKRKNKEKADKSSSSSSSSKAGGGGGGNHGLSIKTGGLRASSKRNINSGNNNNNDDDKEDGEWSWENYKGGTLSKALNTTLAFEEELSKAKNKLTKHIKNKSSFVAAGGDLSKLTFVDDRRASTMRRVSSMYQADQEEVRKLQEARLKQRLKDMGTKLPALPDNYKGKFSPNAGGTPINDTGRYGAYGRSSPLAGLGDDSSNNGRGRSETPAFPGVFAEKNSPLPDDTPMSAPKKFDRGHGSRAHGNVTQTAPSIQTGVMLTTKANTGTDSTNATRNGHSSSKSPKNSDNKNDNEKRSHRSKNHHHGSSKHKMYNSNDNNNNKYTNENNNGYSTTPIPNNNNDNHMYNNNVNNGIYHSYNASSGSNNNNNNNNMIDNRTRHYAHQGSNSSLPSQHATPHITQHTQSSTHPTPIRTQILTKSQMHLYNKYKGTSPPTKPLPKGGHLPHGTKDKKLPSAPTKQLPNMNDIPPPPQTGSVPNLYQSQTHSPSNNQNKKHSKHKGPGATVSPPVSASHQAQAQVQQWSPQQQQWMAQQQNYTSQPNLYNNGYAQQQGQAQGQPQQQQIPQGWTQEQINQYYAQQQQYNQQWQQYYAQQAAAQQQQQQQQQQGRHKG